MHYTIGVVFPVTQCQNFAILYVVRMAQRTLFSKQVILYPLLAGLVPGSRIHAIRLTSYTMDYLNAPMYVWLRDGNSPTVPTPRCSEMPNVIQTLAGN